MRRQRLDLRFISAFFYLICLSFALAPCEAQTAGVPAPDDAALRALAAALADAKTKDERDALLAAQPELMNVELRRAITAQGERQRVQGEYRRALDTLLYALSIAERLGDQPGTGTVLNNLGATQRALGDYAQALDYYEKSLRLRESINDRAGVAGTLNNISIVLRMQGDYVRALDHVDRSLAMSESLDNKLLISSALNSAGGIHVLLGNYAQALAGYERALALSRASGDKSSISRALGNTATVYKEQGDYARALNHYVQSLALKNETGDKPGVALVLNNIGVVHRLQGNLEQALDYYHRSLKLCEELDDKVGQARALHNIGLVNHQQGDYARALDYLQRDLALVEATGAKSDAVRTLTNIGNVHRARGDHAQALDFYRKSLQLSETLKDKHGVAENLGSIGILHGERGEHQQSLEFAERSAALAAELGDRETLWNARAAAGRAYTRLARFVEARRSYAEAVNIIESLRDDVTEGEQERQRFLESKVAPYHGMVELLVAQGDAAGAVQYAERVKARVLLDVLQSGRSDVAKALTAEERERERRLRNELVSLNAQIVREKEGTRANSKRLDDLRRRLQRARLDHEAFRTNLYAAHPELRAKRGEAPPLNFTEMRDLLPDEQTALMEYVVTKDKTFLFVLTRGGARGHTTADVKVYTLGITEKELGDRTEEFRRLIAGRGTFQQPARALYDVLLRPAAAQLKGKQILAIVPDGALWNLPFQALQPSAGRFLLEDAAISYAPSLTALATIRRSSEGKQSNMPNIGTLLAFGDPTINRTTAAGAESALRGEKLEPLPTAAVEVTALGRLYGADRSRVYTGVEARESRVKREAANFRVLQFATHGVLDDLNPMYSHLVLSQASDEIGEDGLLEAWEMMNLNLRANLVVLSACETARGRVATGEGIIGMSWALFIAGSPTTVVSQWKVASAGTAELMSEFHRNLQSSELRMSKADALRRASLKLLRRGGAYRHPFYWAAFVVIGDGS